MPDFIHNHEKLIEEARADIRKLHYMFTVELLAAACFILISIGALNDFALLPSLPDTIRATLGRPPSANMINAALILYVFSAIIFILSRMMSGLGKQSGMSHVGFLAGFYCFYHFSGTLAESFWAVFAAGVTILGLESYHVWIYSSEEIEQRRESLAILGKPRGQEDEETNNHL